MEKSQNSVEEDCYEDRISDLPGNVIECIMDFMPLRDAAKTCVLSSKWRYVWADHPSLVLDKGFWDGITTKKHLDYEDIVNSILLYHSGYIRKFVIDISLAGYLPDFKIDLWLSSVCRRRRLKVLGLQNSSSMDLFKVPSWVFSNTELTHLSLSYCIVNAKDTSRCFTNIRSLILADVTLYSMVLTTPLLTSLTLFRCGGVRGFNISAPRLASLVLSENDYLNLKPFLTCKDINDAALYSTDEIEDSESINFLELLAAWPRISELEADGFCFKYLVATGKMPDILQLNLRLFTLIEMDLDSELIAWILCIIRNSPLLHTFEIWFSTTNLEQVNEASLSTIKMKDFNLRTIKMKQFTDSEVEVMFAKILLHCAPAVAKMLVEENVELDPIVRISILKDLMVLQRAFPKTEIIYRPNLVLP